MEQIIQKMIDSLFRPHHWRYGTAIDPLFIISRPNHRKNLSRWLGNFHSFPIWEHNMLFQNWMIEHRTPEIVSHIVTGGEYSLRNRFPYHSETNWKENENFKLITKRFCLSSMESMWMRWRMTNANESTINKCFIYHSIRRQHFYQFCCEKENIRSATSNRRSFSRCYAMLYVMGK